MSEQGEPVKQSKYFGLTRLDLEAYLSEAEAALHRLAKEAGLPDDGPDENVNVVLQKLRDAQVACAVMRGTWKSPEEVEVIKKVERAEGALAALRTVQAEVNLRMFEKGLI